MKNKNITIFILSILFLVGITYALNISLSFSSNDWHDFYGYIKGAKIGDIITAKDPTGTVCGEYIVDKDGKYGFMHVYSDDPSTMADEGANVGDIITFYYNGKKMLENMTWLGNKERTMLNLTLNVTVICKNDLDCGNNYYLNQLFCKNGNVFQNYTTFTCNNPGTVSSSCTSSNNTKLKQICFFGQICSNGTCVDQQVCSSGQTKCDGYNYYECQNNAWIKRKIVIGKCNVECTKSTDCGNDGYVGNKYCSGNSIMQKYRFYICSNYKCSYFEREIHIQNCGAGKSCNNGQCVFKFS